MRGARAALALLALGAAGCEAIAGVAVPTCARSVDCDALNRRFALATECTRYQCVDHACQLATADRDDDHDPPVRCGGTDCDDSEVGQSDVSSSVARNGLPQQDLGDGVDNDCDLAIDEDGITLGAVVTSAPLPSLAHGATAHFATHDPTAAPVAAAAADGASSAVGSADSYSREANAFASPFSLEFPSRNGCSTAASPPACKPIDLAYTPATVGTSAGAFVGLADHSSCGDGQLFVQWMAQGTALDSPAAVAPAPADAGSPGVCMGGYGVSSVVAASTNSAGPFPAEALFATVGADGSAVDCARSYPVQLVGTWRGATDNATRLGIPVVIGRTIRRAPALITNYTLDGYLLAFSDPTGQIVIQAYPSLRDRADPTSVSPAPSAALRLPAARPGERVDAVQLAAGPDEIALVSTEGNDCLSASSVWFRAVHFDGGVLTADAPVALGEGAVSGHLAVGWARAGMVLPGFSRGGLTAVAGDASHAGTLGGWVVAWFGTVSPDGSVGWSSRRVLRLDGQPLEGVPFALTSPSGPRAGFDPLSVGGVFSAVESDSVQFVAFDPGTRTFASERVMGQP